MLETVRPRLAVANKAKVPGARPAAFAARKQAASRRSRCAATAVAAAGSNTGRTADELAALVAQKEAQMQALFEPGRLQPKAATVAALRKEIAQLRAELQAELGIGGAGTVAGAPAASRTAAMPASLASDFPAATSSLLESTAAAGSASKSGSGRVLNALKLVEAQLAVSRSMDDVSLAGLSREEQEELLRLQEENTALKSRLDLVLARQAQLQLLVSQHIGSSSPAAGSSRNGSSANGSAAGAAVPERSMAAAATM